MAKVKHIRLHTTETGLTIYAYIIRRPSDPDSNLQIFDVTDGKFRETSVDPYLDLTEDTAAKGQYAVEESTIVWTDGFYEFLFYSQLAGAPAPATDDILAVTTNRIKVVNDTIYAVFQTTDLKSLLSAQTTAIIAAIGTSTTVVTKTADYTATSVDYVIIADGTSNTVTITLPTALGIDGRRYQIKCIDATFAVDVDGNGTETIDGALTQALAQWESITIASDGLNWVII